MNPKHRIWNSGFGIAVLLLALLALRTEADFSIPWYSVDGGGGTSTNRQFTITGTIGQPDVGAMGGGQFTIDGGFWSVFAVQTAGAPPLTVTRTNSTAAIWWPLPATGFSLQVTTNLNPTVTWTTIPASQYLTNSTQIYYIEPAPVGKKFYRLIKP